MVCHSVVLPSFVAVVALTCATGLAIRLSAPHIRNGRLILTAVLVLVAVILLRIVDLIITCTMNAPPGLQ